MPVRVGTSGWSYDDWEGAVYPRGLPPGERLRWMTECFPTVEVDSTFYRDPAPAAVEGWVAKTKAAPQFDLSVKAPQALTHGLLVHASPAECASAARRWAGLVPQPLAAAGRLGAALLQLAPSVVREPATLARLDATLEALRPLPVAVELRHRSWHDEMGGLRRDALALLDGHGAACVAVDGPGFPVIVAGEARHAYVRFHGRNREAWFKPDLQDPAERYNYEYQDAELEPWATRAAQLARGKDAVRVYFNNCVAGQAFRNAQRFEELLARQGAPLVRAKSPQTRLPW